MFDFFRKHERSDGSVTEFEAAALSTTGSPSGRRDRAADPGTSVLLDSISQKLLHGWLQNRNQTLVPLTLNFRQLSPEQRECITSLLAAVLTVGRSGNDASAVVSSLQQWLKSIGADETVLHAFAANVDAPGALGVLIERAQALGLGVYAYVGALIASDTRHQATVLIADLLAARFDLSSAVMRSAARRYRR